MKIEIQPDEKQEETKVLIIAAKMTEEVKTLLARLSEEKASVLAGIVISYLITICISLCMGTGEYYPCVPSLVAQLGSPLNAVIVQTLLSAVLGAVFGGASVIWEMDSWSLLKQSLIYFLLSCVAMFPTAYLAHWMPR